MLTTASLQVRIRAHESMLIAPVDVCSRRAPCVSAAAEFFEDTLCRYLHEFNFVTSVYLSVECGLLAQRSCMKFAVFM